MNISRIRGTAILQRLQKSSRYSRAVPPGVGTGPSPEELPGLSETGHSGTVDPTTMAVDGIQDANLLDRDVEDFFAEGDGFPKVKPPTDPALIAARLLLVAALADPELLSVVLAPSSIVVFEVKEAAWIAPVAAAWREVCGESEAVTRPDDDRYYDRNSDRHRSRRSVEFLRDGSKYQARADAGSDTVASCVASGDRITGISHAPVSLLPTALMLAADAHVVLPPMDAGMVAMLAEILAGQPEKVVLPERTWHRATPTFLRLAFRVGQTADAYVARLAKFLVETTPTRVAQTLDDLPGMGAAGDWAREVRAEVELYRSGLLPWGAMDRGALLVGGPGTGKTSLARALASDCGLPFIATSYAAWQSTKEGNMGDVLRSMRQTFDDAYKAAPCFLFVDELDTLGSRGSHGSQRDDWWRAVINALLEAMDGALAREGVYVIGATNDASGLDPALLRAGRLERHVEVPLPDADGLEAIFRVHLRGNLKEEDLSRPVAASVGSTGADIELWVRSARRRARQAGRAMDMGDLMFQIVGDASAGRTADFDRLVAIHESGHCVAAAVLRPGTILRASMTRSATTEGSMASMNPADVAVTDVWVLQEMMLRLAGRAAEQELLGQVTGGSGGSSDSDLARATFFAVAAESAMGFGTNLVWRGFPESGDIASTMMLRPQLEVRVADRLDAAYLKVRLLVRERRAAVEAVADALLLHGFLTGPEIEAIITMTAPEALRT